MGRKLTRKGRIKKLDGVVTKIVRARDKVCVLCGNPQIDSGHLFTRRHHSTRWDLTNCNGQCKTCNYRHNKDTYPYTTWWVKKYGEPAYQDLRKRFWQRADFKNYQLDDMYLELLEIYKREYGGGIIKQ